MKAIRIHSYGDSSVLKYEDATVREIGPDELLIKVKASGVNPVDVKARKGYLKDSGLFSAPFIPGWDVSGVVEKTGSLVTRFKPGDRVFSYPGFSGQGTYAEYTVAGSSTAALVPKNIPFENSAGVPVTGLTAWMALFDFGNLKEGQTVLIHAAAGGVGLFAVQLAKLVGAKVIGTASPKNFDLLKSLGVDELIDYHKEDFTAKVKNVDLVADFVGGETRERSFGVLKKGGIMASIVGRLDPAEAEKHGVIGRSGMVNPNGARLQEIAGLIDAGKIKVFIEKIFPLADAKSAHESIETGHTVGKLVLLADSSL